MTSNLQKMWVTGFAFVAAISVADATDVSQANARLAYKKPRQEHYMEGVGEKIARPVSFSYFSSRYPTSTKFPATEYNVPTKYVQTESARDHKSSGKPQEGSSSLLHKKTIKFPLNTVLPGNSISFDSYPYPELLEAINAFSDLTPERKPQEHFSVTHNTVSLPDSEEGIRAVSSQTRITNGEKGTYPYREFTETTHNAKGQRERVVEREQHLRVHHGINEDPFFDIEPDSMNQIPKLVLEEETGIQRLRFTPTHKYNKSNPAALPRFQQFSYYAPSLDHHHHHHRKSENSESTDYEED